MREIQIGILSNDNVYSTNNNWCAIDQQRLHECITCISKYSLKNYLQQLKENLFWGKNMHVSEEIITTEYAVSSEKVHILQSIIQQYRVDDGIKAQFRIRFFMCWISNIWCKKFFTGKKISNRFNLYFVNLSGRAKISVPPPTLPALVLKFNYQSHPTPHISQNTKPFYKCHDRKWKKSGSKGKFPTPQSTVPL